MTDGIDFCRDRDRRQRNAGVEGVVADRLQPAAEADGGERSAVIKGVVVDIQRIVAEINGSQLRTSVERVTDDRGHAAAQADACQPGALPESVFSDHVGTARHRDARDGFVLIEGIVGDLFHVRTEHQLTADPFISRMIEELSEDHKEVLYFLSLRLWSATQLALAREQSDRNIRKLRKTIHKNLQRQMFGYLHSKRERGRSLTLRERQFIEEYSALAEEQGKDAMIRRENKNNRRKRKPPLMAGTAEGE